MLAAACLILVTAVAGAAGADDLDAARTRRADLQGRLDAAAQRLADIEARAGELATERDALAQQLATFQTEIEAAAGRTQDRVRSLYKRGPVDPMIVMLTTEDPGEALERATIVTGLVRDDRAVGEAAAVRRVQAAAVASRLEERQAELDAAVAAQQEAWVGLQADLQEAAALERRLEEEARRRAEAEARRRAAQQASR
ncbi:MAG: hypothetical protein M3N57_08915, partial [Actinomycetota bacterium]|nr:hypothetical protein [Actinomycetota bacterium]